MADDLYSGGRLLTEGHPDLSRAVQAFTETQDAGQARADMAEWMLSYLGRLRPLPEGASIAVVGCGPKPLTCVQLAKRGYTVTAIEPVTGFAESAQRYLGGSARVIVGAAERLEVQDASQDVILCESILEHVESPRLSLAEMYRSLKPGGVLWIVTTNRWRFSPRGRNDEYNVAFFNWFPRVLKEAYVYHHLHYRPSLANYSLRPAVHWFSYPDLCSAGRDVGFSRFYSIIDLVSLDDPRVRSRPWRGRVLKLIRERPILRAIALTQVGGTIVMIKE